MQEHEYKARDKTVQKMSRDGLREENLRSKTEKRITGREADERKVAGHREQELDFGKARKAHISDDRIEEITEGKQRLRSRRDFLEQEDISESEEMETSEISDLRAGEEKSSPVSRSRLRKDSIRGHPGREAEPESEIPELNRQSRKKKMVTAYASKEQKRYHEKSEIEEKSMEDFREEIKNKTKREQILKERKQSKSRLIFEDEGKGRIPGSGMAKRSVVAVENVVSAYGQRRAREDTDDNAALDAADQAELMGESLARKSVYVRQRLKESRQRNNRLRESVLEETEKSRLQFGSDSSNEAKKAIQKEAEQKKQSALKKLLQKKRYQKQYQAAKQGKAVKDAAVINAQRFTEKAKAAVKELVAQNRNILLSIGIMVLLFALMATSLSSCAALFQGSTNAIVSTSYSSEDEDIYAAENAYVALENALNEQINQMKETHSDYDEFQFQIDEIGHNPYQLISYLTVKYGGFTYAEVADEIKEIFKEQYGLYTDSTRETVTEKKKVKVGESLGQVVTSGYCICPICCGIWSGGPTASGAYPTANHTLAVDASNPFVPMGTKVVMNGVEYTVEDTGAFARYGVQFDVYYDSHAAASAHGHQTWECYLADDNGSNEVEVTRTRDVDVLNVTLNSGNLMSICQDRLGFFQKELFSAYNDTKGNLQMFATPVDFNWYSSVTSYYGYRIHPISGANQLHNGMDIGAPEGTKVMAGLTGTVTTSAYNDSYGNYVVIKDSKGYELRYAHLSSRSVSAGASVTKGDEIGLVGNTGNSTGSHLHIELLKNGERLNPIFYLETGEGAGFGGNEYTSEAAQRLLNEAARYLGTPYVWGGYSPSGFDCSGFVSYCLTHSGVRNTGRLTAQGLYDICTPVSQSEAQPGDLIFFTGTYDAGVPVTHIGIYVGNGQMIHCGHPVQYTSINSPYWQSHFYGFGRW